MVFRILDESGLLVIVVVITVLFKVLSVVCEINYEKYG